VPTFQVSLYEMGLLTVLVHDYKRHIWLAVVAASRRSLLVLGACKRAVVSEPRTRSIRRNALWFRLHHGRGRTTGGRDQVFPVHFTLFIFIPDLNFLGLLLIFSPRPATSPSRRFTGWQIFFTVTIIGFVRTAPFSRPVLQVVERAVTSAPDPLIEVISLFCASGPALHIRLAGNGGSPVTPPLKVFAGFSAGRPDHRAGRILGVVAIYALRVLIGHSRPTFS
jgi:F-type H+-transporting ATPase subunit a